MEASAYLLELVAGCFYILVSVPLLRLHRRTREAPERLLGITFLLMGASYLFYELPFALIDEELLLPFSVTGRLLWDASVVSTALFTREVFHRGQAWADWLIGATLLLLSGGFAVSAVYGDWEGLAPLSNPGFWAEWSGQIIPFAWVTSTALVQYAMSGRRARLGLSEPAVRNRFLLFGLFGVTQLLTVFLLVPMFVGYEIGGSFTTGMDVGMGSLEMLTILLIWLAFFPPAVYRSWVEDSGSVEFAS